MRSSGRHKIPRKPFTLKEIESKVRERALRRLQKNEEFRGEIGNKLTKTLEISAGQKKEYELMIDQAIHGYSKIKPETLNRD